MYTGLLYQNWIRNFHRSIGYPIGPPSKLYEDNQVTIKILLADRITPLARHPNVLITALHDIRLLNTFEMVDTRSNMQLSDIKSKSRGGKSLRDIIEYAI